MNGAAAVEARMQARARAALFVESGSLEKHQYLGAAAIPSPLVGEGRFEPRHDGGRPRAAGARMI